jgi:hypothetical protein
MRRCFVVPQSLASPKEDLSRSLLGERRRKRGSNHRQLAQHTPSLLATSPKHNSSNPPSFGIGQASIARFLQQLALNL